MMYHKTYELIYNLALKTDNLIQFSVIVRGHIRCISFRLIITEKQTYSSNYYIYNIS